MIWWICCANCINILKEVNQIEGKATDDEFMSKITPLDLKAFGLIPEIIGRMPVITYTDELDREALLKILQEPKNALIKQYKRIFELDNVELTFTDEALEYIVDKTIENKLGARGLRGTMENIMTKAMFDAPSSACKIPVIIRIDVVLPAPFGPKKPKISPLFTVSERESTAFTISALPFLDLALPL